ncbi:MAG: hypothetical protein Fur0021_01010 [Candidatus Promineifilaceae bacterium]
MNVQVPQLSFSIWRLSRFDRLVLLTIACLLALVGGLIWRGDRVGITAAEIWPPPDAGNVSTLTSLRITFDQAMITDSAIITLTPAASGGTHWSGNTLVFTPDKPLAPDTLYTASVAAPLHSQQGQQLLHPITWQFRTRQPRILYLAPDAQDRQQLFLAALDDQPAIQLTQSSYDVTDFAVSPDAAHIVYSLTLADGSSNLWLMPAAGGDSQLLVDCQGAVCSAPAWSPDGRRLIYERRNPVLAGAPPGPPRLWWVDVASGQSVPVFADSQWLGMSPRLSPDGRWLSYNAPFTQQVQAYNLETGQIVTMPSQTGEPTAWSPDSRELLLTEIQIQGEQFAIHIFSANVYSNTLTNLSGGLNVSDGFPTWSFDGQWIAFNRKLPRAPMGKQLWLMRPNGRDTRQLTQDADVHHGPPHWSPDGRYLLFQRFVLTRPSEPGIWLIDVTTQTQQEIARIGIQPAWLP